MSQRGQVGGFAAMFVTMLIFWFFVSGVADWQHLVAGAAAAFLVTWFWKSLLRRVRDRHDILPYRLVLCPESLPYLIFLIIQIIKANVAVALVVLNPRLPISPVLLRTRTCLRHDLTRVMYAHSITLTPGTVTLSLTGDHLVVHSLTERMSDIEGLEGIERRIVRVERRMG